MKVLIIPGSLRKESFNKKLAVLAAKHLTETGHTADVFDIGEIPLYNEDVANASFPESAKKLKDSVLGRDLIVFCSPEYNYGIPGVLKNAIDYSTRPFGDNPYAGKTAVVMGVSNGRFGTVRGQIMLRSVLTSLDMLVVPQPQLHVMNGDTAFSENGTLTNDKDADKLKKLLDKGLAIADKLAQG